MGAMFFFGFGGAWLAWWAHSEHQSQPGALFAILACTFALLVAAYRTYRSHAPALRDIAGSPDAKRKSKLFNYINAAQGIAIVVIANVLSNVGLREFVVPAIILVVGLHFLPLARVFANPPHFVTGVSLIALAVAYPLLAPSGPQSGAGPLGAGLILWCSAAWALRRG